MKAQMSIKYTAHAILCVCDIIFVPLFLGLVLVSPCYWSVSDQGWYYHSGRPEWGSWPKVSLAVPPKPGEWLRYWLGGGECGGGQHMYNGEGIEKGHCIVHTTNIIGYEVLSANSSSNVSFKAIIHVCIYSFTPFREAKVKYECL